jgi:dihydroorotase
MKLKSLLGHIGTMKKTLIKNARIVTDMKVVDGDIYIEGDTIIEVADSISAKNGDTTIIDAEGKYVLPGVIDDQVHFREPGLTYWQNIATESAAAVVGGITSYGDALTLLPQTTSMESAAKEDGYFAARDSYANYAEAAHENAQRHRSSVTVYTQI